MKTLNFVNKFLRESAKIAIVDSRTGNIEYEGEVGDAPYRLLRFSEFVSVDGLGSQDDLLVTVLTKCDVMKESVTSLVAMEMHENRDIGAVAFLKGDTVYAIVKSSSDFQLEVVCATVERVTDESVILTRENNPLVSDRWVFPKSECKKYVFISKSRADEELVRLCGGYVCEGD